MFGPKILEQSSTKPSQEASLRADVEEQGVSEAEALLLLNEKAALIHVTRSNRIVGLYVCAGLLQGSGLFGSFSGPCTGPKPCSNNPSGTQTRKAIRSLTCGTSDVVSWAMEEGRMVWGLGILTWSESYIWSILA